MNFIIFVIFLLFVIFLARVNHRFVFLNFYVLYGLIATIFISFFLEKGVYLLEIQEYSYAINLPAKGSFVSIVFIFGVFVSFVFFQKSSLKVLNIKGSYKNIENKSVFFVIFTLLISLTLIFITYGFPYASGLHRNDYWAYNAPSWGGILTYWLVQTSFLLGYIYNKNNSKYIFGIFLFLLFFLILCGERFTGLLQAIVYFLTCIFVRKESFSLISFKNITYILALTIASLYLVLKTFGDNFENAQSHLLMRLALQAQMWWALDVNSSFYPKDLGIIVKNYIGLGANYLEKSVNYLMYQFAPFNIVESKIETGSRFTMSGLFNHLYFFGYIIGPFITLFWGVVLGFFTSILCKAIQDYNIIVAFCSFKILMKLQSLILVGADFDFVSLSTLLYIIPIFLFLRLR